MQPKIKRTLLKTAISLLGLNVLLISIIAVWNNPIFTWDEYSYLGDVRETPVISPPDLPPTPYKWPPRKDFYECNMRAPSERDYILMDAIATHNPVLMADIPSYIAVAIEGARERAALEAIPEDQMFELELQYGSRYSIPDSVIESIVPESVRQRYASKIGIENVLEYINYDDMKNIVLIINRDARRYHGEPYLGFDRYLWLEEFTGVQYDQRNEIPIRDEAGDLVYRRITTWQAKRGLGPELDIDKIVQSFKRGLYNKDPRVRLECLSILREMGPNPIFQDDIQHAGQLLETIGDWNRGFRFTIQTPRQKEENDYRALEVATRRYVYCDIDAAPHWAVPYYQFAMFNKEINRMKVLYQMEIDKSLQPSDFRIIDANMFITVTDSINIRGSYGIDRATYYGLAPHRHPETDAEIAGEERWNGIYPEYRYADTAKNIPKNLYVRNQSAFNYLVRKILPPWEEPIPATVYQETEMDEAATRRLILSLFASLEHRNYYVRIRAANFLYQMYRSSAISRENQRLIMSATLTNRTLRETMKAEFIPRKRIQRLHMYISANDYDGLRDDMIEYDEELGDELFGRFAENPETQVEEQ